MGKWLYGEYTDKIDLIENPDLYLEVVYRVESYETKVPYEELPDKIDYDVTLWLRLLKCRVDEVDCKVDEEFLKKEYEDIIIDRLYKIWDLIDFSEVEEE
jgi:hypothetical protein